MSNGKNKFAIQDVESIFHGSGDGSRYKVLNISITPDLSLLFKLAEGKAGSERTQVVISLSVEELLKLAKLCEVVAEMQMKRKIEIALEKMK